MSIQLKTAGRTGACLVSMFWLLSGCGPDREGADAKRISLEHVLTVDTENEGTAEMGLTDIGYIDADSAGNIVIANPKAAEHFIFLLDEKGRLMSSFGSQGQGPGEFQSPRWLAVSKGDEIYVTGREKVVVFDNAGKFLREFRIDSEYQRIVPLNEDRCLAIAVRLNEDLSQSFQVILCSSDLVELKTLDSSKIESFKKAAKVNIIPTLVYWETSGNRIYTGNSETYDIRVFDFEGRSLGRITKDEKPVSLSEKDREEYERRLQKYPPEIKKNFFIPDVFPPFRGLSSLGDEWLFVRTYEETDQGVPVYDIFRTSGEFAGRMELEGYQVKFKGDRAYVLRQKESGYKELVVYGVRWDQQIPVP